MTRPSEVLVQVADLRAIKDWFDAGGALEGINHSVTGKLASPAMGAITRLVAAIPEPEWEPTDDIVTHVGRALESTHYAVDNDPSSFVVRLAKAMHREGLL